MRTCSGLFFVGALLATNCLPGDIRPEPGHIFLTAQGSSAATQGFTTDDGWTVHFDKLLVGMGYSLLAGDSCEAYGESRYTRLFDFTVPGAQKLGELYGLGECDFQFHRMVPREEAYLEKGVTVSDFEFMRELTSIWSKTPLMTSTYLRGTAARGEVVKRFDWRFYGRATLTDCKNAKDSDFITHVPLKGGEDQPHEVTFHPENLFRDNLDDKVTRRFGPIAKADENDDGEVTLEELAQIPAPLPEWSSEMILDAGVPDGGVITDNNAKLQGWARFMNQKLIWRLFRLDGRYCPNEPEKSAIGDVEFEIDF
jgi:hypothetical protein